METFEEIGIDPSESHEDLVILVDEIQAADPKGLRTLAYAWQHLQAEGADVPAAGLTAGCRTPRTRSRRR
jgi:hypothetical protein